MKLFLKWQKLKKETSMFLYELIFYLELFFSLSLNIFYHFPNYIKLNLNIYSIFSKKSVDLIVFIKGVY